MMKAISDEELNNVVGGVTLSANKGGASYKYVINYRDENKVKQSKILCTGTNKNAVEKEGKQKQITWISQNPNCTFISGGVTTGGNGLLG